VQSGFFFLVGSKWQRHYCGIYVKKIVLFRKGNNALVSHFSNIITLLKPLDKTDTVVLTFFIKHPIEVPCLPATSYTSLFSKFNELCQVVLRMSSKLDNYEVNFSQLPRLASVLDSHATVIISKGPDSLYDPLQ